MNEIYETDKMEFIGIIGWIIGGLFFLLVLFLGMLIALEMVWRTLAIREKKKLLKRWDEKYGVKK